MATICVLRYPFHAQAPATALPLTPPGRASPGGTTRQGHHPAPPCHRATTPPPYPVTGPPPQPPALSQGHHPSPPTLFTGPPPPAPCPVTGHSLTPFLLPPACLPLWLLSCSRCPAPALCKEGSSVFPFPCSHPYSCGPAPRLPSGVCLPSPALGVITGLSLATLLCLNAFLHTLHADCVGASKHSRSSLRTLCLRAALSLLPVPVPWWGQNGQLGLGDLVDRNWPTAVTGLKG